MHIDDVPAIVAVGSGKGGVGKTTVSIDLTRALRDAGLNVGLVDADVSTPNSPEVLGGEGVDLTNQRLSTHDSIVPPIVDDIQLISQGVVLPDDVPVLRDGGWRAETVADFINDVEWADDTDVVVIDTPPGTGEEIQVIVSAAKPDYAVIVATPHPSAIRDATKTHEFFKQYDTDHGAVLNMAYIPSYFMSGHALSGVDFTEIDGVGDAISEEIAEMIEQGTDDFPLFGYDGSADAVPSDVLATVPYTVDYANRRSEYDDVVGRIVGLLPDTEPHGEVAEATGEGS